MDPFKDFIGTLHTKNILLEKLKNNYDIKKIIDNDFSFIVTLKNEDSYDIAYEYVGDKCVHIKILSSKEIYKCLQE